MNRKNIAKEIFGMLKSKQKLNFIWIIAILTITAGLSQLTPIVLGSLTDYVLAESNMAFVTVLPYLAFILLVNVVNEVLKVIRRLIVEGTATQTEKLARQKATVSLLEAPLSYFRENMSGNIHGRLNRSIEGTVKLIKLMFMDFAPAIASGIAAIFVIFTKLPFVLAIISVMVIPIGTFIVFRQISTQKGIRVELMETKAGMDGTIVELLGGIETIRALDSVSEESERIDKHSEELRSKEMNHHKAMAIYDCLKFLNEAIFSVIVIAVSVYLASKGRISVGAILTTYLCYTQLTGPLRELHRILDEFSECVVLANDYFAILHIPMDFSYQVESQKDTSIRNGSIDIQNLNFAYPEKPQDRIISDMQLTIPKGQFLGIAGPSGCGKSSLIKILAKLEPAEGDVAIDGYHLSDLSREDLSESIAYVPQTPFLFAGTVYHNICYGLKNEVTIEEVREAARRACIDDTIENLPGGYEFVLSEGGKNLSGGQRQRLAIARIFLRRPKILILDEATSALDNTSEKLIQGEIEKLKEETGTTILSIAHRLTTLQNCDRIIVMDKGQIIQSGTYESLSNEPGMFQQMERGKAIEKFL